MFLSARAAYRFGPFELRGDQGLYRDGVRLSLTAQPLELLHLLVEGAGETVSRATIQDRLWGHAYLEVDLGINRCVREIRAALGDDARRPVYVETLIGRGYRFVAPVRAVAPASPLEPAPAPSATDTRSRLSGVLRSMVPALVLGAVIIGVVGLVLDSRDPARVTGDDFTREDRRAVAQADILLDRRSGRGIDRAIGILEDLLARHPTSPSLHARLAYAHSTLEDQWGSKGHITTAREHATVPARLDGRHPAALLATGAVHYGNGEPQRALADLDAAREGGAEGPYAALLLASTLRDQGRWDRSSEILEEALERFPQSFDLSYSLAWNAIFAHDFETARGHLEHMKLLDPGHHLPRVILPMVELRESGDPVAIETVVEREASVIGIGTVTLATRQMARLLGYRLVDTPEAFGRVGLLVPRRRFNLHRAEGYWYAGQRELALQEYVAAEKILRSEIASGVDEAEVTLMLASANAGLGALDRAVELVDHALELSPMSGPVPDALLTRLYAAEVLTRVGEEERALDLLEFMIAAPSPVTSALLEVDPVWRPLRDRPRFRRLLQVDDRHGRTPDGQWSSFKTN